MCLCGKIYFKWKKSALALTCLVFFYYVSWFIFVILNDAQFYQLCKQLIKASIHDELLSNIAW